MQYAESLNGLKSHHFLSWRLEFGRQK